MSFMSLFCRANRSYKVFMKLFPPLTSAELRGLFEEQQAVAIHVNSARLCVDCDVIHQASHCPRCLGSVHVPIRAAYAQLAQALSDLARRRQRAEAAERKAAAEAVTQPVADAQASRNVARIENGRRKQAGRQA